MKSKTPKVLHEIAGRSLVGHVVSAARELEPEHLVVVVGHAREQVRGHLEEHYAGTRTAVQEEQNGTGHAVRMALEELGAAPEGTVVVVCGDTRCSPATPCAPWRTPTRPTATPSPC